ncbi:hypothetical protein [Pontibacter sp. G13]|uniref:hypothetical protein n=1 Tax=Pontibacter sp. G13 TaxID=3074898 RepID=UPI0028895340|nr:hypothetical protein [Pontibacter sp. G13]WNJ19343.1 hypothetical protein RJD25_02525 [Pontibacter sp. G13]
MKIRNAIAFVLIILGLFIMVSGFNKQDPETVTQEYNGQELTVLNTDAYNGAWRPFLGGLNVALGFMFLFIPLERIKREASV